MLETTFATRFIPGSNIKGEVVGASWRFALPRLRYQAIVCIGFPSKPSLIGLCRAADEVVVVAEKSHWATLLSGAPADQPNLRRVMSTCELPPASADLVVAREFPDGSDIETDIRRILKPDGVVYLESKKRLPAPALARSFGRLLPLWLDSPGEVAALAPLDDRRATRFLVRYVKRDPAIKRPKSRIRDLVRRIPELAIQRRYGYVTGTAPTGYLRPALESAGLDPQKICWALAAPGTYSSKKIVFFMFEREANAPAAVIKITRDPQFNGRLENEFEMLRLLGRTTVPRHTFPQPLYLGYEGKLAVVAESAIDGMPFRLRSRGGVDCPHLDRAVEWLGELATSRMPPSVEPHANVAEALARLLDRFLEIYQVPPPHADFLRRQIAVIGEGNGAFPLVFQHGDPGIWNALVTSNNRVAFLDWESAESRGMPLWDLYYFFRSYARLGRGALAERWQFIVDPRLVSFLSLTIDIYCNRLGLSRKLAEPLFYTCWMHRALKEATRLRPETLERGQFIGLLRACIEERESPLLQAIFSPARAQR